MTVILGGLTFTRDPIWTDYGIRQDVMAVRKEAIDGTEIIVETARASGFPITLEATMDTGWLTGTELGTIRGLAAILGWTGTLNYRGSSYTVRFRHEEGAIVMRPRFAYADPVDATTLWIGQIKLMTVGT
jgi:hypothetical protein